MPSIPVPGWTPPTAKKRDSRDHWRAEAKYDDPEWAKEHGLDKDKGSAWANAYFSQNEAWDNWGEGLDYDYAMDPPIVFDDNQEATEFFKRNGKAPRPGLYVDGDAGPSSAENEADAMRRLFELLEQVEEHTDRAWQKNQEGTLRPDSYAYSVDMLLNAVIAKCGKGRPGLALEDVFHLGRFYAYLQIEDREDEAAIGRKCVTVSPTGVAKRRVLDDEQRKAANARYHQVLADEPGLKVTPARRKVAKEFGCSTATIRRIVETEFADKK